MMNKRPSLAESMRAAVTEEPERPAVAAPSVVAVTSPVAPQPVVPPASDRPTGFYAATREGKKKLTAPVSLTEYKHFRHLGVEIGKTNEGLLREAISDLFVKYGKPPISDVDA
jgi:hypothetical protein